MTAPRLRRLLAPEHRLLALLLLALLGAWLFGALASEVAEGDSRAFDVSVLRALRDPQVPDQLRGPAWLLATARDLTALGGYTVVSLALVAALGFVLLGRRPATAMVMLAAGAGGMLLNLAMKHLFARPRPSVVPWLAATGHESFPSGHAMLSAAVYLSLATLLARVMRRRRLRLYVVAVAVILVILIGSSRVALGVHYPTDVAAGWLAGGLWALLCGIAGRALQRRGAIEAAPPGTGGEGDDADEAVVDDPRAPLPRR